MKELTGSQDLWLGLKGLAIAGLFAVIMSTGDSYLNTGGIFLSRNILSPISRKLNVPFNELKMTKLLSLIIGICAMAIAYLGDDILKIKLYLLWYEIIYLNLKINRFGASIISEK